MQEELATKIRIVNRPFVRWSLWTAGTLFVGLGILGIFLPLLPTTVFFLMAAWCYARSSKKFYDWLHHNKYFGKYLRNYREGKGITMLSKISSIAVLWGGILYSVFAVQSHLLHLILLIIAAGVTIHIFMTPTYKEER